MTVLSSSCILKGIGSLKLSLSFTSQYLVTIFFKYTTPATKNVIDNWNNTQQRIAQILGVTTNAN